MTLRIAIVGAGFTGAVIARELAEAGHSVDVFESRDHVAGNAYDATVAEGIRIHAYGPHLFHTKNLNVYQYFRSWCERAGGLVDYRHRVKAQLSDGSYVTLPANAETARILGSPGKILDVLFRPYTRKMWGMELEELNPSIIKRVPIRDDDNEDYFPNDPYQFLPEAGYTKVIQEILSHDNIHVYLNREVSRDSKLEDEYDHVFNCAPIDKWYNFEHGELGWRSIKFHTITVPMPKALPVPVVNFTHAGPCTRVTEWSQLPNSPKSPLVTFLTFEEPCDFKENGDQRYYPIQDLAGRNRDIYHKYESIPKPKMTFVGRCGRYQYIDMDMAIGQALHVAKEFLSNARS